MLKSLYFFNCIGPREPFLLSFFATSLVPYNRSIVRTHVSVGCLATCHWRPRAALGLLLLRAILIAIWGVCRGFVSAAISSILIATWAPKYDGWDACRRHGLGLLTVYMVPETRCGPCDLPIPHSGLANSSFMNKLIERCLHKTSEKSMIGLLILIIVLLTLIYNFMVGPLYP